MPFEKKVSVKFFFWGVILLLGVFGWLYFVKYGDTSRAWRALLVNFIFWTPLATGMIVWPAVVIASQGLWAKPLERTAFSSVYFWPASIVAFIALWFGQSHWAGWLKFQDLSQGFWLNSKFVFLRDAVAIVIMWVLCFMFVIRARKGSVSQGLSGLLCFTYGIVWTLLAFDMVMALDPHWFSTLFGAYFFVSGMYAALVCWTILSVFSGTANVEHRHDLGKLIVAVSLLTAYMMFSQLLPIWYENLFEEVRFVIPRLTMSQWRYVSAVLVATIYLGPLVLLLTRWSKRSPVFLLIVSLLLLACLWVERWWEVTPALGGRLVFGLTEISITVAFIASFMLSIILFNSSKRNIIRQ
jgi:hypothetical protein